MLVVSQEVCAAALNWVVIVIPSCASTEKNVSHCVHYKPESMLYEDGKEVPNTH